ncbi:hypothetical protein KJ835_02020 [Patescibacteria group bacterium]|nr:hypothetical protein [Patescibacteria group bacterium]
MIKTKLSKFAVFMDGLKHNKKALIALIAVDFTMAALSNIVDWPWLMSVDWYLRPFTPICSLFPLTLGIWFTLHLLKKKIPAWYTAFIFMGIVSYGIMSYIYYPLYMIQFTGFDWRTLGNMLWVTIYALQSLTIFSELKPVKLWQFALIASYYLFKDFSDRYLGSFIDLLQPGFPEWLKDFFGLIMVLLHLAVIAFAAKLLRSASPYVPADYRPAADTVLEAMSNPARPATNTAEDQHVCRP